MMTLQKLAPVAAVSAACLLGALGLAMAPAPQGPTRRSPKTGRPPRPTPAAPPKAEPVETPGAEAGMDLGAFLD